MSPDQAGPPVPLVAQGQPVTWWFVFKLNTEFWEGCGGGASLPGSGLFGGSIQAYDAKDAGLQYVYASSQQPGLQKGSGCLGSTLDDPVGATFSQVYNGTCNYVLWNDQFYGEPIPSRDTPWGHSKGMLAWDDSGNGLVMQVSTPSWPASGRNGIPRGKIDGNTLGYVKDDDVEVSQHFFALRLNKGDVLAVLSALHNARVVSDPTKPELARNGGPQEISDLVAKLGQKPKHPAVTQVELSSGVTLISKPSTMHVPPWQLVSAELGGIDLRVASWWANPAIESTGTGTIPGCWDDSLEAPGAVDIAITGTWDGRAIGLEGGSSPTHNHAKVGVSTNAGTQLSIFGDLNQQGALCVECTDSKLGCASSQNGRGGLFFVLDDAELHASLTELLEGDSAPLAARTS